MHQHPALICCDLSCLPLLLQTHPKLAELLQLLQPLLLPLQLHLPRLLLCGCCCCCSWLENWVLSYLQQLLQLLASRLTAQVDQVHQPCRDCCLLCCRRCCCCCWILVRASLELQQPLQQRLQPHQQQRVTALLLHLPTALLPQQTSVQ
jgi:hypothetical protein